MKKQCDVSLPLTVPATISNIQLANSVWHFISLTGTGQGSPVAICVNGRRGLGWGMRTQSESFKLHIQVALPQHPKLTTCANQPPPLRGLDGT